MATTAQTSESGTKKPGTSWKLPPIRSLAVMAGLFAVGAAICLLFPVPEGLQPKAWRLFVIFVLTIIGLILQPFPLSVVSLAGMTIAVVSGVLQVGQGLSGFSSPVMWMILVAILVSRGIIKSGLGERIAYFFVAKLGKRTIGVAYGLGFTDLVLAPATPSAMARGGAIVLPILTSIAKAYDSVPFSPSANRVGKYLILTAAQINSATGAMFLTAMAANPLMAGFAEQFGVKITWMSWFTYGLGPGIVSLLLLPLITYVVSPPEIKHTPKASEDAREHLRAMGPLTTHEKLVLFTILLMIFLWTVGNVLLNVNATITTFVGLLCLLYFGGLTWDDVLAEKAAWDTLIWFACLLTMAGFLNTFGFIPWFTKHVASSIGGLSWPVAFVTLSLVYFYAHYFFASLTSHVASMYVAFVGTAVAVNVPPVLAVMTFGFLSSYFSTITHYGGAAPTLLFAQGFIPTGEWWRKNFIMSLFNLPIWIGGGAFWLKFLGAW